MRSTMTVGLLFLAAAVSVSSAQANNSSSSSDNRPQQQQQQRSVWDEPIRFSTKAKDSCTMAVSAAGDHTRLRVSCKGPSQGQAPARSYHCDFQGKPDSCRAYNLNPRHYFTQMMWDVRKLSHACQGAKVYRPAMCRKHPDEAQMTLLSSWPKTPSSKPSKPVQEVSRPLAPAKNKPVAAPKPAKPQPAKPQPGRGPQSKRTTAKPAKGAASRPTEQPDSEASRVAAEYCWTSLHGVCTYFISWFQN